VKNFNSAYEQILGENSSVLLTELWPALLGGAALMGAGTVAAYNDLLPDQLKKWQEENPIIYAIAQIVDPTGILSWTTFDEALSNWDKDPTSTWNNVFLLLSFLAMAPVVGVGARMFGKIVFYVPRKVLTFLGFKVGKVINGSNRLMKKELPRVMAQLYGKNTKIDRDAGAVFHEFLKKNNINVDKNLVKQEMKRQGIKLDPKYVDRVTASKGGVAKTLATLGRVTGAVTKGTVKAGGALARPAAALYGMAGAPSGKDMGDLFDKLTKSGKNPYKTGRTPGSMSSSRVQLRGKVGATTPARY
jgi:hypothetical protein